MSNKIVQMISELPFFNKDGRSLRTDENSVQVNNYIIQALYHDEQNPETINSVLVVRGAFRPGGDRTPGYLLITTKGADVKLDIDEGLIIITTATKDENDKGVRVELPVNCEEGEFFQQTLVHNLRNITFDFIQALYDVRDVVKACDEAECTEEI